MSIGPAWLSSPEMGTARVTMSWVTGKTKKGRDLRRRWKRQFRDMCTCQKWQKCEKFHTCHVGFLQFSTENSKGELEGIADELDITESNRCNLMHLRGTVALSIGNNSCSSLSRGFIAVSCILTTDTVFFTPQKETTLASRHYRGTYSGWFFSASSVKGFWYHCSNVLAFAGDTGTVVHAPV